MAANVRESCDSEQNSLESLTGYYFDVRGERSIQKRVEQPESNDDRLEQSTLDYFNQVGNVLEANDFQDEEDKKLFVRNVFKSMKGEEMKLAQNKKTSKVLEAFLRVCSEKEVSRYAERIEDSIESFCNHHCASHVIQTLLETSLRLVRNRTKDRSAGNDDDEKEDQIEEDEPTSEYTIDKFVKKVVGHICTNLDEMFKNEQASHVICSAIEVLSGHKLSSLVRKSKRSHRSISKVFAEDLNAMNDVVIVPSEFTTLFITLVKAIVQLEDIERLAKIPCSSVVLQFVILALHKVDEKRCKKFVKRVSASIFIKKRTILEQLTDQTSIYLVEVIIEVSTSKSFAKLFKKYFKRNLKDMGLDQTANFVLQRLIKKCPDKPLFEEIFDELENCWVEIAAAGHVGVLTCLSESCVRLVSCQVKFVKNLSKMLNCEDFSDKKYLFIPLVASLSTYEEWNEMGGFESNWNVNYYGSVLIQNIVRFHKPFRVVESLIKMPSKDLFKLLCNPFGSYIMDAIMDSKTLGGASKTNLLTQMKTSLVDLACDKFGSRCLEALFKGIDINGKFLIAEILKENINELRSDPIGKFAITTFGLVEFKKNSNKWMDYQKRNVRKRDLFSDVLSQAKKKQKK